uniref:Si:dkey-32e6.3 n=1 Tax=Oryzias sinensis TaxID=183150 RepID=A0A8C7YD16_9TELE
MFFLWLNADSDQLLLSDRFWWETYGDCIDLILLEHFFLPFAMGDVNQSLQFSDTDEAPPTPTVALTMSSLTAGQWEWLSDTPSLLPPHSNAESYYSHFGRTVGFTSGAGRRFRGALDEHLQMLRWPEGMKDKELSIRGEDGCLYHWILPSFFQLLKDLTQEGLDFAVVFRTFGTDLPRVLRAMSRVLQEGLHPLFPDLPELKLSVDVDPGDISSSRKGVVLTRGDLSRSSRDGERSLYQYLSSLEGLGGFRDNFEWWAANKYSSRGGKPLWIDPFDQQVQHIFIDDNIRQNDEDTVVNPKVFLDPGGSETRTACTSELYDIALIQNDLLRAISDRSYFTQRIHICMENYDRNLQQGAG